MLLLKGQTEIGGLGDALGQHPELLLAAAAKGKVDLAKQLLQGRNVKVSFLFVRFRCSCDKKKRKTKQNKQITKKKKKKTCPKRRKMIYGLTTV